MTSTEKKKTFNIFFTVATQIKRNIISPLQHIERSGCLLLERMNQKSCKSTANSKRKLALTILNIQASSF